MILSKLVEAAESPASQTAGKILDVAGKSSVVTQATNKVVEVASDGAWGLNDYAIILTMMVSAMWLIKLGLDVYINIMKYRRGDY